MSQAVTGLVIGPIFVALAWLLQTERVVNRTFDGFVRSGRNTVLERDTVTRRLLRIPIVGMAMGVFVFGYSLANLLFA